jgi:hypothetical protein
LRGKECRNKYGNRCEANSRVHPPSQQDRGRHNECHGRRESDPEQQHKKAYLACGCVVGHKELRTMGKGFVNGRQHGKSAQPENLNKRAQRLPSFCALQLHASVPVTMAAHRPDGSGFYVRRIRYSVRSEPPMALDSSIEKYLENSCSKHARVYAGKMSARDASKR